MRALHEIANEIWDTWDGVNYAAKPYLYAMGDCNSINDMYGMDSAKSVVLYFLANVGTWRGPDAKRIKAELKEMVGMKRRA
jgi:hypothetical protein